MGKYANIAMAIALSTTSSMAQVKLKADNIEEVIKAMTLQEKAELLVGRSNNSAANSSNGLIGAHAELVPGAAGSSRSFERLGIPPTILTDGPAGVRINPTRENDTHTYYATGFPVGTSLACTWNTELVEEVGKAIGNEVLEYGCDVILAPGMNLHRSPLCGRNFEYYSEDPFLTGNIAAAYVNGVQSQGVGTSIKHFAGNSQEVNRLEVDEIISKRALRELYLKGFEICVRKSQPWTVMSSYNKLNGPYTQENGELLTTILRDEWGFKGVVMTDWTGQRNTAKQIAAGNDMMEPGEPSQVQEIIDKVKSGELSMDALDLCVRRTLQYIVKTPHFRNYKFSNRPDLKAHAAITRQSATEGMVLLKNDRQTLPLSDRQTVAVFGASSYDFIAGGSGSGDVNKAYTIDLMQGIKNAGLSVTEDLATIYSNYKTYQRALIDAEKDPNVWFWGTPKIPEMPLNRIAIAKQAEKADVALLTIGRQAGEGDDRYIDNDFNLTNVERQLLEDVCMAFHQLGKRVIVILNMGGAIETASWKNLPDAILMAWQPGQEGGNSVADVLLGKENPSGRLSMTFPLSAIDVPALKNYPHVGLDKADKNGRRNIDYTLHQEDLNVGYRYFNTKKVNVSYPFGYGLSYTTFTYTKPTVKATKDGFEAQITVTNTGNMAGKEVVQLYVSAPKGGLEKPTQELKAFAKTKKLKPNESQTLTLPVSAYDLASYNEASQSWETAQGKYILSFSSNVEETKASATYNQAKAQSIKCHDVMRLNRPLE